MSILKSNNADITTVLDQVKQDYFTSCRNTVYLSNMTDDGLLRDVNNVPIHINDLVWILPDPVNHTYIKLGRVTGNSACFVDVYLGKYSDTDRSMIIRKHPDHVLVVSIDEVREVIDRAKNQK